MPTRFALGVGVPAAAGQVDPLPAALKEPGRGSIHTLQAMDLDPDYFAANGRLRQILAECAIELFESHKVPVFGPTEARDPLPHSLCGIVGIKGPRFEATVVLACPEEVLCRSHPAGVVMRDWVGELANQLAGRVKHALWNNGAGLVYVTPPCILNAGYLRAQVNTMDRMPPLELEVDGFPVVIWFDGEMDASLVLQPADVDPFVSEGGVVMF